MDEVTARLPGSAVNAAGEDLLAPLKALLGEVQLLPTGDPKGAVSAAFTGQTESLNVIKAGATALSKTWAAGLGASVVAMWASVATWWGTQDSDIKIAVILAAGLASAAVAWGIAYIVASDVRGRAAATVALLQARGSVTERFLTESASVFTPVRQAAENAEGAVILAVSPGRVVRWTAKPANDEEGWILTGIQFDGNVVRYWLMKGAVGAWAPLAEVEVKA